jgi:hypothetical protein
MLMVAAVSLLAISTAGIASAEKIPPADVVRVEPPATHIFESPPGQYCRIAWVVGKAWPIEPFGIEWTTFSEATLTEKETWKPVPFFPDVPEGTAFSAFKITCGKEYITMVDILTVDPHTAKAGWGLCKPVYLLEKQN